MVRDEVSERRLARKMKYYWMKKKEPCTEVKSEKKWKTLLASEEREITVDW